MTVGMATLCVSCARYRGDETCEAFPDGVPGAILWGGADHRNPWPGDNGKTYQVQEGLEDLLDGYEQVRAVQEELDGQAETG